MSFTPLQSSFATPVTFPLHHVRRSPTVFLNDQRGRIQGSHFAGEGRSDVGTFTGWNDSHSHVPGPGYSPAQIFDFASPLSQGVQDQLSLMDSAGVNRMLWMGIPTNIVGGKLTASCGDGPGLGRTYYLPDRFRDGTDRLAGADLPALYDVRQYYNLSIDWQLAKAWTELPADVRERLLPSITGINLQDTNSIHGVMRLKREYPDTFHWAGEITGGKGFVEQQNRDYTPAFDEDAAIHANLAYLGRAGMGVTLHWDVSDEARCIATGEPGRSERLAGIRSVFARHQANSCIVWAHLGGLGRSAPPSAGHVADLRAVLKDFPNVCIDMSWSDVATHYSPHPQPAFNCSDEQRARFDPVADRALRQVRIRELAALIEEFPGRFLMGSDALVSHKAASISSTYAIYSNLGQGPGTSKVAGLFDHLKTDTQVAVLRGNFDRLYDQAKGASRKYETQGLHKDMDAIHRQTLANGRTPNVWPGEQK